MKNIAKGSVLAWLKALPVVGKHLLQRNIIKFSIPAIYIPFSIVINYYSTGKIGNTAKQIYRDRAVIEEKIKEIY